MNSTRKPQVFYDNPWDVMMSTALKYLGTTNPQFVGRTFFHSIGARLVKETGATKEDIFKALRDFPQRLPPPVLDLCAFCALITANWQRLGDPNARIPHLRVFGHPAVATPVVADSDSQGNVSTDAYFAEAVPAVRGGVDEATQLLVDGERLEYARLHSRANANGDTTSI